MCRYAFVDYKPHYACFNCRKTFKRRLAEDLDIPAEQTTEARCPRCGELTADMGLDFKSPPKSGIKAWAHLKDLYSVGISFHTCGCYGPGYIPKNREELLAYFEKRLSEYHTHLKFCQQRVPPVKKEESKNERKQYMEFVGRISYECRTENEKEKTYWIAKIKELEQNMAALNIKKADIKYLCPAMYHAPSLQENRSNLIKKSSSCTVCCNSMPRPKK